MFENAKNETLCATNKGKNDVQSFFVTRLIGPNMTFVGQKSPKIPKTPKQCLREPKEERWCLMMLDSTVYFHSLELEQF